MSVEVQSDPVPRLGSLQLSSRWVLAPLAGYTTLAFRLVTRELGGVGLATTDLVNARALLRANVRTCELIQTNPADRPLSVQIYGTDPREMAEAAQWLQDYGASVVDINMGCPVHKVVRGGGGSAMMCNTVQTVTLVRAVVEAVRIPVTVKMRLGWDEQNLTAPYFAREFEQAGVAAVIIHGRTREQGFGGTVNLDGIRAVVEAVERIPVIGNGDVRTLEDAQRMRAVTGCHGVAIGRGALLNPWFFAQLLHLERTGEVGVRPSWNQHLAVMDRHFHLLVEQRGERHGCVTFRKVANWYCRVLKPGRQIQQQLVRIEHVRDFEAIVAELKERGLDGDEETWLREQPTIPTPRGPISHW